MGVSRLPVGAAHIFIHSGFPQGTSHGSSSLERLQQGQIALDQSLEEPVLFKRVSFRAADERQMGVQNKSQCPVGHFSVPSIV